VFFRTRVNATHYCSTLSAISPLHAGWITPAFRGSKPAIASQFSGYIAHRTTNSQLAACCSGTTLSSTSNKFQVATGAYKTCVLARDGCVACFGYLEDGCYYTGAGRVTSAVPVRIAKLTQVTQTRVSRLDHVIWLVSVGEGWNCAERSDATLWCWVTEITGVAHPTATPQHMPGFDGAHRTTDDGTTMCGVAPEDA
jgi:hypothetical protein